MYTRPGTASRDSFGSAHGLHERFQQNLRASRHTLVGHGQSRIITANLSLQYDLLLHILPTRVAKHLSSTRRICYSSRLPHHIHRCPGRVRPILKETLQTPWEHLLETDNQDAIGATMTDHIPSEMKTCRTSGAIVVDIVDWDLCHAELVENTLAACAVAVAVTRHALIHIIVVDLRIKHGLDAGFEPQFGVIDFASRFDELGQSDTKDVGGRVWLLPHDGDYSVEEEIEFLFLCTASQSAVDKSSGCGLLMALACN